MSEKDYNKYDEYWEGFTAGREYERFIQKQEKDCSESNIFIPGKWINVKCFDQDYVKCSHCGIMFNPKVIFHEDGITYTNICPNCSTPMTI